MKTTVRTFKIPIGWETKSQLIQRMLDDEFAVKSWNMAISDPTLLTPMTDTDGSTIAIWSKQLFLQNSWQLTLFGCTFLCSVYKDYYINKHNANYRTNGRILINLSKLVNGPWYIHNGSVYTWNQSVHFELVMFDGNVHDYVNFNVPK